jgi:alpha-tubulin suppressor-like RCC1 family protein
MPIFFNNTSHDIAFGRLPIEKMGGDKLTYSMYGEEIPVIEGIKGPKIIKLVSTVRNLFVLYETGNLYGIGDNVYGQLGIGDDTSNQFSFIKIAENVKDVFATSETTFYIDNNDYLYGAGYDNRGCLGNGYPSGYVKTFSRLSSEKIKDFKCYSGVSWFLTQSNDLYGCGWSQYNNQGTNVYNPTSSLQVDSWTKRASGVVKFDCGSYYNTVYLSESGDLYGAGTFADIGRKDTFTKLYSSVKDFCISYNDTLGWINKNHDFYVTGLLCNGTPTSGKDRKVASNINQIKIIGRNIFCEDLDGKLYGCGRNHWGQLGLPAVDEYHSMTELSFCKFNDFSNVSGFAYMKDNNVYYCGDNANKQFTDKFENPITNYQLVLSNVLLWSVDSMNCFYYTTNGKLYGCGRNNYGQLGTGVSGQITEFVQIKLPEE